MMKLTTTSTAAIVNALKDIFSRDRIPETVFSDNGPQHDLQELAQFSRQYNFTHVTSSPYFPQSNGQAERTVQIMKKILKDSDDPYLAILSYHLLLSHGVIGALQRY